MKITFFEMISIHKIETLPQKKLIGKSVRMSLLENKTPILWKSFMQQRHRISNAVDNNLYSLQVYDALYFENFSPETKFTKYALTEVKNYDSVPEEMEAFTLQSGLYAVFLYKGLPENFKEAFPYIFQNWLPSSAYELDHRPHFELLDERYDPTSDTSEEEVWIPIRKKSK